MAEALFLKSGAAFGYGYSAGESGLVRAEDITRLVSAGVIQVIEKEKREKAVSSKPVEKR